MRSVVAVVALLMACSQAQAFDMSSLWRAFDTPLERHVDAIRDARERGEYDLADSLIAAAERDFGEQPMLVYEAARVALARGHHEAALAAFRRAADLDPTSTARVDAAALLVQLGRWPEAVEVLEQAFDERGGSLKVEALLADKRFAPMVGFAPYDELIRTRKEEQAGVLGRLLIKLVGIEASARAAGSVLARLSRWMGMAARLLEFPLTGVVLLLGLAAVCSFGVAQLTVLQRPWTFVAGMAIASGMWHVGSRIVTRETGSGADTILWAALAVAFPQALASLWGWRRRRRERNPARQAELATAVQQLLEQATEAARTLPGISDASEERAAELKRKIVEDVEALRQKIKPWAR